MPAGVHGGGLTVRKRGVRTSFTFRKVRFQFGNERLRELSVIFPQGARRAVQVLLPRVLRLAEGGQQQQRRGRRRVHGGGGHRVAGGNLTGEQRGSAHRDLWFFLIGFGIDQAAQGDISVLAHTLYQGQYYCYIGPDISLEEF